MIWRHCTSVVGWNTRCGRHSNVRAQFVKRASGERVGTEMDSRSIWSAAVGIVAMSTAVGRVGVGALIVDEWGVWVERRVCEAGVIEMVGSKSDGVCESMLTVSNTQRTRTTGLLEITAPEQ